METILEMHEMSDSFRKAELNPDPIKADYLGCTKKSERHARRHTPAIHMDVLTEKGFGSAGRMHPKGLLPCATIEESEEQIARQNQPGNQQTILDSDEEEAAAALAEAEDAGDPILQTDLSQTLPNRNEDGAIDEGDAYDNVGGRATENFVTTTKKRIAWGCTNPRHLGPRKIFDRPQLICHPGFSSHPLKASPTIFLDFFACAMRLESASVKISCHLVPILVCEAQNSYYRI